MIVVREYVSHSSNSINTLLCFTMVHVASLSLHVTSCSTCNWIYCREVVSVNCVINVLKGTKT